jgi:hypothetical protein
MQDESFGLLGDPSGARSGHLQRAERQGTTIW